MPHFVVCRAHRQARSPGSLTIVAVDKGSLLIVRAPRALLFDVFAA
jgi:hypothetical protein